MRCVSVDKKNYPRLLQSEWIAPNATILGNVETGKYSSLYHGVIIRGDTANITIGKNTQIQDNTQILNTDINNPYKDIMIGEDVVIGVNCYIDGATIEDGAFIGNGVSLHQNSIVKAGAMVAAGSVVQPNTTVPSGQVRIVSY